MSIIDFWGTALYISHNENRELKTEILLFPAILFLDYDNLSVFRKKAFGLFKHPFCATVFAFCATSIG